MTLDGTGSKLRNHMQFRSHVPLYDGFSSDSELSVDKERNTHLVVARLGDDFRMRIADASLATGLL